MRGELAAGDADMLEPVVFNKLVVELVVAALFEGGLAVVEGGLGGGDEVFLHLFYEEPIGVLQLSHSVCIIIIIF